MFLNNLDSNQNYLVVLKQLSRHNITYRFQNLSERNQDLNLISTIERTLQLILYWYWYYCAYLYDTDHRKKKLILTQPQDIQVYNPHLLFAQH